MDKFVEETKTIVKETVDKLTKEMEEIIGMPYDEYSSMDEVLMENTRLTRENKALKDRFCGCGNCQFNDKECSSMLSKNLAYCNEYKLEE